jgi:putative ABC transport system permease protein
MILNFIISSYRHLIRHKGFTLLNIAGLTIGIVACLLISLFIRDEKQFDKFIPGGDRIFRVYYTIESKEGTTLAATTPPAFSKALGQNFPAVENTLRLLNIKSKLLFENGKTKIYEEGGILSDPSFFDFFPLKMSSGSSINSLNDPTSIAISDDMAKKLFNATDVVGKEITVAKTVFKVSAVFERNPRFHLNLNFILPLSSEGIPQEKLQDWGWYGFYNYVKLNRGANINNLEFAFQRFTHPILNKEPSGSTFTPHFQPISDIHLYSSNFEYDMAVRGSITYVFVLILIGVFVLLIACFNFVNLATAKSIQRAKEVGVRKTIGASRFQLFAQFIVETIMITLLAVVLSVFLTAFCLPYLNEFVDKNIDFDLLSNGENIMVLSALTIVIGILAGFYPALVLSGYKPINVLKGNLGNGIESGKSSWIRKGLVVIQFSLSILLMISAIIVIRQVDYLHNKELGFKKDQILFFPMRGNNINERYETLKTELQNSPAVSAVSIGYGFPGDMWGDGTVQIADLNTEKKTNLLMVDHDYIKTLGLQVLHGRDFSKEITSDNANYIINETAVREFGLGNSKNAIGKTLLWATWKNSDSLKRGQVIGVVKDFHFKSLHDKIEPGVLQIYPPSYWKVAVKVKSNRMNEAITHVKNVWQQFTPEYPIEYNFLDENFARMYKTEDKLKSLISVFTVIAIFVACLGLFGMAAYTVERRRKEIGIRKVLGSSVSGIVLLISKEFLILVVVALLIASPIAWYAMSGWLQDFAYRIDIDLGTFILAGMIALLIAFATVSFQAIKAAFSSAVNNIRTE